MTTVGMEMSIKQFKFRFMMDKEGGAGLPGWLVDSSSRWKVTIQLLIVTVI